MAQTTGDVLGLQLEGVRKRKTLPILFHYNDVFFNRVSTRTDVQKVSSREYRVPMQLQPGSRFGSFNNAGGALGRGTAGKYDKATLTPITARIAVEINDDVLDQTDGEPKSVLAILAREISNAMKEFRVQMNASLQTSGNGVLGTITALPGANVFTLASAPFYTQLLRPRQKVSVYDSGITTNRGECEVTRISSAANNVTMNLTPPGTIVTDVLLPEGLTGAAPAWFLGIPYHASNSTSGTWQGYSRSTTPEILSHRVNGNGNALTTPPIRLALNKIIQRMGTADPKSLKVHCHPAQKATYEELASLISEIHKGSGNESVDLFFNQTQMAGVALDPPDGDIHAARDRIDFTNLQNWGRIESKAVDFKKLPNGQYFDRPIDSTSGSQIAAVIFWIYWFGQIFTDNPGAFAYIDNLAVPDGYEAL